MKIGFVSWQTDDTAGLKNRKIGFVWWHTDAAAGWENVKTGFVSQHKFQNLLYSFHASAWLQYLSPDQRAPSAPAVLVTNLTDFTPLHWQFIVKTWKTWGNPQKHKLCNIHYIFKYCIYGLMMDD
jgi:hypothetical protein